MVYTHIYVQIHMSVYMKLFIFFPEHAKVTKSITTLFPKLFCFGDTGSCCVNKTFSSLCSLGWPDIDAPPGSASASCLLQVVTTTFGKACMSS